MRLAIRIAMIVLLGVALVASLIFGSRNELERRRVQTLAHLDWIGGPDRPRRVDDLLSNAVAVAARQSLAAPKLVAATARFGAPGSTNGFLWIDWIADSPTADGMALIFGDSQSEHITFDQWSLDNNKKASRDSVIFSFVITSDEAPSLWLRLSQSQAWRVVLTAKGKPISNELEVRWVSK